MPFWELNTPPPRRASRCLTPPSGGAQLHREWQSLQRDGQCPGVKLAPKWQNWPQNREKKPQTLIRVEPLDFAALLTLGGSDGKKDNVPISSSAPEVALGTWVPPSQSRPPPGWGHGAAAPTSSLAALPPRHGGTASRFECQMGDSHIGPTAPQRRLVPALLSPLPSSPP